jgi:hypothetical protein
MCWSALKGQLAMVEFLLGLGFDLEATTNVCLHLSYMSVSPYSALRLLGL